jgi:hypothetical protein
MFAQRAITFAVATYGTDEILKRNFLASPCLRERHGHQVLIQRDYASAAKAYNDAIDHADNDLLVCAHQDMILPESWPSQLWRAIERLDAADPTWGVAGCYGTTADGTGQGYIYSPGRGVLGAAFESPTPVQTLDEIVLIFRRSSGLRFDALLPHFHLYGADICLRAANQNMRSYAIPAFCIHNANHYLVLPPEFYRCYWHIRRVWKDVLPIRTSCITITKYNESYYIRRLSEARMKWTGRKTVLAPRVENVSSMMGEAEVARLCARCEQVSHKVLPK